MTCEDAKMLFARTSKNIARRKVEGEKPFIDHLPEYINLFSFTLSQPAPERHELWDLYFPPENGKKGDHLLQFCSVHKTIALGFCSMLA